MNIKNYKFLVILGLIGFILMGYIEPIFAQGPPPPPPPPPGGGPPCWPPPCIPINKGLVFLAIASLILASYKLKLFRSKTTNN